VDKTYRIFTDGSAIGNPGPGGWGAVVMRGKGRWEMSGAVPRTTISEMELLAAVEALRPLPNRIGKPNFALHEERHDLVLSFGRQVLNIVRGLVEFLNKISRWSTHQHKQDNSLNQSVTSCCSQHLQPRNSILLRFACCARWPWSIDRTCSS
jgi:hypothetical protein